jgi:hypothetical protein
VSPAPSLPSSLAPAPSCRQPSPLSTVRQPPGASELLLVRHGRPTTSCRRPPPPSSPLSPTAPSPPPYPSCQLPPRAGRLPSLFISFCPPVPPALSLCQRATSPTSALASAPPPPAQEFVQAHHQLLPATPWPALSRASCFPPGPVRQPGPARACHIPAVPATSGPRSPHARRLADICSRPPPRTPPADLGAPGSLRAPWAVQDDRARRSLWIAAKSCHTRLVNSAPPRTGVGPAGYRASFRALSPIFVGMIEY